MNERYEPEAERQQAAKDRARQLGHEVLTPLAAKTLFGKSAEAVRKAVREQRVDAAFDLWVTDKSVALIVLGSAINYWGQPDSEAVERMRENGQTISVDGVGYNILHPTPLLNRRVQDHLE